MTRESRKDDAGQPLESAQGSEQLDFRDFMSERAIE